MGASRRTATSNTGREHCRDHQDRSSARPPFSWPAIREYPRSAGQIPEARHVAGAARAVRGHRRRCRQHSHSRLVQYSMRGHCSRVSFEPPGNPNRAGDHGSDAIAVDYSLHASRRMPAARSASGSIDQGRTGSHFARPRSCARRLVGRYSSCRLSVDPGSTVGHVFTLQIADASIRARRRSTRRRDFERRSRSTAPPR
jgi:hypothetical protein